MLKFKEYIKLTPEQKMVLINRSKPSSSQRTNPPIDQAADVVTIDSSTRSPTN
jgi:hypothetical protein